MSVSLLPKGVRVPSPPKAAHDGPPEAAYYHGFCSRTLASSGCRPRAQQGSWALDAHEATNWTVASDACFRRCAACEHCAFFSVGLKFRDCGWFRPNACELGGMSDYPRGFRTFSMAEVRAVAHREGSSADAVVRRSAVARTLPPKRAPLSAALAEPFLSRAHNTALAMALSPSSVYNFGERHWQMLRAARAAVRKPATNLSGRCAVVGSSAALFDAKHGSEIDAARHVLRLNNAPVPARWREHIGQRTTLRVNTHQAFREREDDEYGLRDIPQVVYCHHEGSGCWNGVQTDGLDRIAPGFVQATIDELGLQSGWPTSGLIAVALARSMCAEVHVYGFGLSKTQPCAKYYGRHCEPPAQYQKTEWHDFALEKDYLDRESVPVLKGFGETKCSACT